MSNSDESVRLAFVDLLTLLSRRDVTDEETKKWLKIFDENIKTQCPDFVYEVKTLYYSFSRYEEAVTVLCAQKNTRSAEGEI
ncbi:hypothetical protein K470DRAFT_170854 [Piedraia hortae CBS 480.64]|uniref:Uncharacterized protein n=1 Tax=Piedraia hortae CBS 480.64 TaxID=1314780 RepID=A0A6A7BS25_9PEZI|nr:hypothetical protein K470DRAFT_170854 [Piedraia hortae CBS 480.64]